MPYFENHRDIELGILKRMGVKLCQNSDRSIMVKFCHYGDKNRVIYNRIPYTNSISIEINISSTAFKEIQMVQDNYMKCTLNLPKNLW